MFALQEDYPDLKADGTMRDLMEELSSTENKVSFERQQHARRRTGLLVLVFLLAVAAIVAAATAVAWGLLTWIDGAPAAAGRLRSPVTRRIVGATLAVIAGGSTMRWIQLALGGGDRVATMVGGRLLDPDTKHPQERVLINVVEEMAIASGVTVPNV